MMDFPNIVSAELRNGDVLRNYSDISKANKLLDWYPKVPLRQGIERTIQYFTSQKK